MMKYNVLYFADLDIADVLTSVGITITVGETEIMWAHDFGDLGGEPEGLDCTPLSARVKMEKSGLIEQEKWTVDYYFNKGDFNALEALKAQTQSTTIKVKFADGTAFTNTGKVSANYLAGQSVNGVADAHAVIDLSGANGWQMTTEQ